MKFNYFLPIDVTVRFTQNKFSSFEENEVITFNLELIGEAVINVVVQVVSYDIDSDISPATGITTKVQNTSIVCS